MRDDGLTLPPADVVRRYQELGYWREELLDEFVLRTATQHGDRIAVLDGSTRISYAELAQRTREAAAGFAVLGLRPGDRIVVRLPNSVAALVTVLGAIHAGLPPVLMVPALGALELRHVLRTARARALVISLNRGDPSAGELADEFPELIITSAPPSAPAMELAPRRSEDVAFYLLSGGTTGPPKIIPRTHRDYVYNIERSVELAGFTAQTRYLAALPVLHNFALGCPGVFGALAAGGQVVLSATTLPALAQTIDDHAVTATATVPGMAKALADRGVALSNLLLQVGGAKLLATDARRLLDAGLGRLQQVFGMAEGLLNFTRLDDPPDVIVGTQGRPASEGDELLLLDQRGEPVAPGQLGQLHVRGPYTIRSYLASAEVNAASFTPDGYYRTGDLARWHESGNIVVEGRRRDFVNRGGEKVSAGEVEELLTDHPKVRDCAIVPSPHEFLGEAVCAVVVAARQPPELLDLRRFLRDRGLAPFKLPERLICLDQLPLTPVGKLDRVGLTRLAAETSKGTE